MNAPRPVYRVLLVAVVGLILAACGSNGASTTAASSTPSTTSSTATPTSPTTLRTVVPPTPTTRPPAPPVTATTVGTPSVSSGVEGRVAAGPTCPVERVDQPCPPRPVQAEVQAKTAAGVVAGTSPSDSAGHFAITLSPGDYTLVVVTGSTYPRCPETPVSVRAHTVSHVDIDCDTGIR